jgi:hypothetical protein
MRLAKRNVRTIRELKQKGYWIHKAVLTHPNYPEGELRTGIEKIYSDFRALRRAKVDGKLLFDEIVGSLVTLECPYSAHADWNVHLNVLFVTKGPWLSYKKLRDAWGYQLEIVNEARMARITEAKLKRRGEDTSKLTRDDILMEAVLEVIKYPVLAVSMKSEKQQGAWNGLGTFTDANGRAVAPPMVEWPAAAFHEWWTALKGFRRTRGYGELYNTKDLPLEQLKINLVGTIDFEAGLYRIKIPWADIDLIQGDKLTKTGPAGRQEEHSTGPPASLAALALIIWSDAERYRKNLNGGHGQVVPLAMTG